MQTASTSDYTPSVEMFSDSRTFDFSLVLINDQTSTKIKKDSIKDLIIEDSAADWYAKGYIDISSPDNVLEQSIVKIEENIRQTYIFRNDTRDFLYIHMAPNIFSAEEQAMEINDTFYTLTYTFCIYSVKDIIEDNNVKIKRLYFWDYRYQMFRDKNNRFTTSAYLSGDTAHMTDYDRKIPTGDAIRNLITETISLSAQFAPSWESGPRRINYTSPSNNRSIDDLQLLLDGHVSSDETGNQPCLLHTDRLSGVWSLIPLGTIFDGACKKETRGQAQEYIPGILQSEIFTIGRELALEERETLLKKSRIPGPNAFYFNYSYGRSSCISSYRFVEMKGDVNQQILNTTPVHQYDSRVGTFSINMKDTNIAETVNYMRNTVVNNMVVDSTVKEVPISINFDGDRLNNESLEHIFDTGISKYSVLASSRNKSIKNLLMQSNAIEFTVPGETTRQAAKFISVEHNDTVGSEENTFNDKMDGQYFVINVIHRIKNGEYTNRIIGVKPYNYRQIFEIDELILANATATPEETSEQV